MGFYLGRTPSGHVVANQNPNTRQWDYFVIPQDRKLDAFPPPVGSHFSSFGPERGPKVSRAIPGNWEAATEAIPQGLKLEIRRSAADKQRQVALSPVREGTKL